MAADPKSPEPFSLSRWSRRKLASARVESPVPTEGAPAPADAAPAIAAPEPPVTVASPDAALPPIESLSIDSDFGPFMQPKVAEDVKRAALKKLFSDPHFNVMDGLDTYIDDYTKADPMPAGMLDKVAKVYGMLSKELAGESDAAPDEASAAAGPAPAPIAAPSPVAAETLPPGAAASPAPGTPLPMPCAPDEKQA